MTGMCNGILLPFISYQSFTDIIIWHFIPGKVSLGVKSFVGHDLLRRRHDIRELKNHDEVHDDDVCWPGKHWNENVSFGEKKET